MSCVLCQDHVRLYNRGSLCMSSVHFCFTECVRWELKRKAFGPRFDSKQVTCRDRMFCCHLQPCGSALFRVGFSSALPSFLPSVIVYF